MNERNGYRLGGDNYEEKISRAAERLWNDRLKLQDQLIDWEIFTTKYIKEKLPASQIQDVFWKRARSRWAWHITAYFFDCQYDAILNVTHNQGVRLLLDKEAIIKLQTRIITKLASSLGTAISRSDECRNIFPGYGRMKNALRDVLTDQMYALIGRVDSSLSFSKEHKEHLKQTIQAKLPLEIGEG